MKLNLRHPYLIENQRQLPTIMQKGALAAVSNNTVCVTGLGNNADEIWKYNWTSGWGKCASLSRSRGGHCAEFMDEILYICGGLVSSEGVTASVEAYNAVADTMRNRWEVGSPRS